MSKMSKKLSEAQRGSRCSHWSVAYNTELDDETLPLNGESATNKMSFAGCVGSMTKTSVGIGLLQMPFLFANAGVFASTLCLGGFGLFSSLCSTTLLHTIDMVLARDSKAKVNNMEDIAGAVFGKTGKGLLKGLMLATLACLGIAFLIIVGSFMGDLFGPKALGLPLIPHPFQKDPSNVTNFNFWFMYLYIIVIPMILLKDMSMIAKLSVVGVVASGTTVASVLYTSISTAVSGTDIPGTPVLWFPAGDASAIVNVIVGIIVNAALSYGAALVVPSCRREAAEPNKVALATHTSHAVTIGIYLLYSICAVFCLPGIIAKQTEGGASAMIQDVQRNAKGDLTFPGYLTVATTMISVLISYPLLCSVIFSTIESSFKMGEVARISYRLVYCACGVLVAMFFADYFGPVAGFVASLFLIPICVFFPILAYWKEAAHQGLGAAIQTRKLKFALHIFIFAVSAFACAYGTYQAAGGLYDAFVPTKAPLQ